MKSWAVHLPARSGSLRVIEDARSLAEAMGYSDDAAGLVMACVRLVADTGRGNDMNFRVLRDVVSNPTLVADVLAASHCAGGSCEGSLAPKRLFRGVWS